MIIAIDGPSGAGKSTLGKMLAEKLNLLYLDTGAMYRAVGLAVLLEDSESQSRQEIIEIAEDSDIELSGEPYKLKVMLNGVDVTKDIRTNEVGQKASVISTISEVRKNLVERQRKLGTAAKNGSVLDGRDIGTVVFPNADIKFYLTAELEARARRRFNEDAEKGIETDFEKTLAEIAKRDERDKNRKDSPLQVADDAIVIDTSDINEEEVFRQMMKHIEGSQKAVS